MATAVVCSFAETVDGIKYNLDETNHTASVTTHTNTEISNSTITIPSTIRVDDTDYTVTMIENNAFKNCIKLKNVTISEGVTTIGDSAFYYCPALTSINIPSTVT